MRPYIHGREKGIASTSRISNRFVHAFGFSNGCAEFALKKPPPFVPSSLMTSWEATGPPWIVWLPPTSIVTSCGLLRFWMTPPATSTSAPTNAMGSRMRVQARTRSTQKLPIVAALLRAIARHRATATAMPVAAETKFCTVRPAIWTVYPAPDSPP